MVKINRHEIYKNSSSMKAFKDNFIVIKVIIAIISLF